MADQIKLFKFNPDTHILSDDPKATGKDCYAILRNNLDAKTNTCFSDCLKGAELIFPAGFNPNQMPEIHNHVEVKPNITVSGGSGSNSLKKKALLLLTGAAIGIIGYNYGTTIANYALTGLTEIIKNVTYSMGSSTINAALGAISNVGSFFGSFFYKSIDSASSTPASGLLNNTNAPFKITIPRSISPPITPKVKMSFQRMRI